MKVKSISSTSAMVTLLAGGEIHTSGNTKQFLDMLDLEHVRAFVEGCLRFWPHYGHLVKNRKSCILNLACDAVADGKIRQVIIPGAGLDTLSLEINARHGSCKIFEIDVGHMDTKTAMLRSIDPSIPDSIRCITRDLSDTDAVVSSLIEHGWDSKEPSLMILEGISYYLPANTLWKTIGMLGSESHTSQIIMEYLIPYDQISEAMRPIAQYPFDLIANDADIDHITRYDISDIAARAQRIGGSILHHYDMNRMQQDRLPGSTLFQPPHAGWIEVCMFSV